MLHRSRRLEALLGGSLDTVTYADLTALVGNPEAAEGEDLDYKREISAFTEEQKAELAKDVAAFANHIGGLLIVGMAEAKGIPSKVMDSDVSDEHQRHLHQVLARHTAPPVRFAMRAVPNPDPDVQGKGFLLLAVPRSPQGPHAVTAPVAKATVEALRYPRRGASRTQWLTETDVATAYQRRFSESADRSRRLTGAERELLHALPPSNLPHLIVSVTPETPGDMIINREAFAHHQAELLNISLIGDDSYAFEGVRIGSRRLTAFGGDPTGYFYNHCDLHRDGSGSWALRLYDNTSTADSIQFHWAEPDTLVWLLLSALHVLGGHARDRTGATGTALIKAAVVDAPHSHPEGPARPQMYPLPPFRIDTMRASGTERLPLSTQSCAYADSEAVALLDDLTDAGPSLIQTASLLADELVQAFGIAEAPPLTRAGQLRQSGWSQQLRRGVLGWAEKQAIEVLTS